MNEQSETDELATRRLQLQGEIDASRDDIAAAALAIRRPIERTRALVRRVGSMPPTYALLLVPLALLALLRPRVTLRLAVGLFAVLRIALQPSSPANASTGERSTRPD